MCSGKFTCNYKGVLRTPSNLFLKTLSNYKNQYIMSDDDVSKMILNNQIKIPDIYELHLSFKSLLPNTFNNFIFQYALNSNIQSITEWQGVIQDGLESGVTAGPIQKWGQKRIKDGKAMSGELDELKKKEMTLTHEDVSIEIIKPSDEELQKIYAKYERM